MEVSNNAAYQQQSMQISQGSGVQEVEVSQKVENVKEVEQKSEVEKIEEEMTKIDSPEQMDELVNQLNDALSPFNTSLKFGFDNKSDDFYVSLIESKTNKLIRRFPAEDANAMVPKMKEFTGMFFDQKG